jgi:hypothetical protein
VPFTSLVACCAIVAAGCGQHHESLGTTGATGSEHAAAAAAPAASPNGAPVRTLVDRDCPTAGSGAFDLTHVQVTAQGKAVTVTATYAGDANGHDLVLGFPVGKDGQVVQAERFEDGSAVARVIDAASKDSTFVDTPFSITAHALTVTVGPDLLRPSAVQAASTAVTMSADGVPVETCA